MNIRPPLTGLGPLLVAALVLLGASGCTSREESASATTAAPTTLGNEIDDTIVTANVKAALLKDGDVKGLDVKVETRKGVVMLSGFVDTPLLQDRVLQISRGVEGVKQADNGMSLKDGPTTVGNRVDDTVITAQVKAALLGDPGIKSLSISTLTSKGRVQLSGFVDNAGQIDQAVALARAVNGVQDVANDMTVKK